MFFTLKKDVQVLCSSAEAFCLNFQFLVVFTSGRYFSWCRALGCLGPTLVWGLFLLHLLLPFCSFVFLVIFWSYTEAVLRTEENKKHNRRLCQICPCRNNHRKRRGDLQHECYCESAEIAVVSQQLALSICICIHLFLPTVLLQKCHFCCLCKLSFMCLHNTIKFTAFYSCQCCKEGLSQTVFVLVLHQQKCLPTFQLYFICEKAMKVMGLHWYQRV